MIEFLVSLGFCLVGVGAGAIVTQGQNSWLPGTVWLGPVLILCGILSFVGAFVRHRMNKRAVDAHLSRVNIQQDTRDSSAAYAAGRDINISGSPTRSRPQITLECLFDSRLPGAHVLMVENNGPTATRIYADPITIAMSTEIIRGDEEMQRAFSSVTTGAQPTEWTIRFEGIHELATHAKRSLDYRIDNIGALQIRDLDFVLRNSAVVGQIVTCPLTLHFSDEDGLGSFERRYMLRHDRYGGVTDVLLA